MTKTTLSRPSQASRFTAEQKNRDFKRALRRASESKGVGSKRISRQGVPSIELYQSEDCPYSHRVRARLSDLGLDFIAHSVPQGLLLKHERLIQAGGKDQVPFLIDHSTGAKLYESAAILTYLDSEYGEMETQSFVAGFSDQVSQRLSGRVEGLRWRFQGSLEKAQRVRSDLKDVVETLTGLVRGTIGSGASASQEKASTESAAPPLKSQKATKNPSPVPNRAAA